MGDASRGAGRWTDAGDNQWHASSEVLRSRVGRGHLGRAGAHVQLDSVTGVRRRHCVSHQRVPRKRAARSGPGARARRRRDRFRAALEPRPRHPVRGITAALPRLALRVQTPVGNSDRARREDRRGAARPVATAGRSGSLCIAGGRRRPDLHRRTRRRDCGAETRRDRRSRWRSIGSTTGSMRRRRLSATSCI